MEEQISDSSSSSDDDEDFGLVLGLDKSMGRKRIRVMNYMSATLPNYSSTEFRSHYRLNKSTFDVLLGNKSAEK